MMFSTHIAWGALLGYILSLAAPELQLLLVSAGAASGFLPDLDMLKEHRKTFHRPFQYLLAGIVLLVAGVFVPLSLVAATLFLGMSLHGFMEIFSSGKTMRPKQNPDPRGVYNHFAGEWIEARYWAIDGTWKDLLLTVVPSTILIMVLEGSLLFLPVLTLLAGVSWTLVSDLVRKELPDHDKRFSQFLQEELGFGPELQRE